MSEQNKLDEPRGTRLIYRENRTPQVTYQRVRLRVEFPGVPPRDQFFDSAALTVGASEDNDLVIGHDTVSRHHFRVFLERDRYIIEDLQSTNGTFLEGVPIREAFLLPGSQIRAGDVVIGFEAHRELVEVEPFTAGRMGQMIGQSPGMREVFAIVTKIAPTDSAVVIYGETGTGKELVARAIHEQSHRKEKSFEVFDCGAVPKTLIESELFGHERGAFTGANMRKIGVFERSHRGTLFLDEIGELPLELQPRLLRALERREVRRVGGDGYFPVDTRVVAATNRDLAIEVEEGRFRRDLYHRLDVVRVSLPALRERPDDIALLVRRFLDERSFNRDRDGNQKVRHVSPAALQSMLSYNWPGNVRELLNAVERAVGLGESDTIRAGDLPPSVASDLTMAAEDAANIPAFKEAKQKWVEAFARDYLLRVLERNNDNVNEAAKEAELHPKYLRELMARYGVSR